MKIRRARHNLAALKVVWRRERWAYYKAMKRRWARMERLSVYASPLRWAARRCRDNKLPEKFGEILSLKRTGRNHLGGVGQTTLCGQHVKKARPANGGRLCVVCRRIAEAVGVERLRAAS